MFIIYYIQLIRDLLYQKYSVVIPSSFFSGLGKVSALAVVKWWQVLENTFSQCHDADPQSYSGHPYVGIGMQLS